MVEGEPAESSNGHAGRYKSAGCVSCQLAVGLCYRAASHYRRRTFSNGDVAVCTRRIDRAVWGLHLNDLRRRAEAPAIASIAWDGTACADWKLVALSGVEGYQPRE